MANTERNGVFWEPGSKKWFWCLEGKLKVDFRSVVECAKDYCAALTDLDKKYADMFTGRTWPEIYVLADLTAMVRSRSQDMETETRW